jgi:release factor glutamine methyltransferase
LSDVFHPQFTISTKLLMQFLESHELNNKSFLELGCGTGFISVLAAKNGAKVLATDINSKALENTTLNAQLNHVKLEVLKSDLFDSIPNQVFDYIIINPPYYPRTPKSIAENAWFCGENFEYFEKLFSQLGDYFSVSSKVFMILSEDCQLASIEAIANRNKFEFSQVSKSKKWGEWNTIYHINKIPIHQ